ncbi:WD domain-containing protein [Diplocarpon mali]|nr:WD domain-containing protein [Diplocarpon mali]
MSLTLGPEEHVEAERELDEDELASHAFIQSLLGHHVGAVDEDEEQEHDFEGGEEEDDNEGMGYEEIEVQIEEEVNEEAEDPPTPNQALREHYTINFFQKLLLIILGFTVMRRQRLVQLLQNAGVGGLLQLPDDELDDDEDDNYDNAHFNPRWRPRRRNRLDPNRFPKVPSDKGIELMNSGTFGSSEAYPAAVEGRNNIERKKRLTLRVLERELAMESPAKQRLNQRLMAQGMIPASNADMIIHYEQPVYSGQFSDDGNFFFSANKDYKVRMYDTSNPYKWRYYKTVEYPMGQWTLTDASLSPDNKYLAYTSIRSQVCLAPTDPNDSGDPYILDLSEPGIGRSPNAPFQSRFYRSFGIWSIRYSGDGTQLVAGTTGGSIVLYDIESRRSLHKIFGHEEDVNAVCFADKSSPHILYSGSDDTTLKVWDTRSMGDSRAAGAFVGHIEGLTYIDSKGDGRYILSNGKDQSMKLWDLRMVMPPSEFERIRPLRRATNDERFEYRWGSYDPDDWYQDPYDNSVVTFRGHRVLRTLIRCHFSPPTSTNSRYVYSGSEDGKVYIYNMDATLAGKVDVYATTRETRPRGGHNLWDGDEDIHAPWKTCVRDASWHPNAPMIVASAWNGYGMSSGTCTVHSWNDGAEDDEAEPKMGLRVDRKLRPNPAFYDAGEMGIEDIIWDLDELDAL